MPLPLFPLALIAVAGGSAYLLTKKDEPDPEIEVNFGPALTHEQANIYAQAMATIRDPAKLRHLAAGFRKAGHPISARKLEQRARLHETPQETKRARRAVMKRALKSRNPNAVHKVADGFAKVGADGAAAKLREYAASITAE